MKLEKKIDLHMHSCHSDDGEFTPEELVQQCVANNIKIMAITDHNSVAATQSAQKAAAQHGIHYINGIEIDCVYDTFNLHLLGYCINPFNPKYAALEADILNQEKTASLKRIEHIETLGFQVDRGHLERISKFGVYTGEMIAEVLLEDRTYLDHDLLKPYREGGTRGDNPFVNFYWDYFSQGKPCHVGMRYQSFKEAVDLIRSDGGIPVLAHPGANFKKILDRRNESESHQAFVNLLKDMQEIGLQGMEVFSSYHDESLKQYLTEVADSLGLLLTCGSDYHGKTKPSVKLGCASFGVEAKEAIESLKTVLL